MIKKPLSFLLSFGLILQVFLPVLPVYAAGSLVYQYFQIDGLETGLTYAPGDTFRMNSKILSSGGVVSNLKFDMSFSDTNLTYSTPANSRWYSDDGGTYGFPIPDSGTEVDNNIFNPTADSSIKLRGVSVADKNYWVDQIDLTIGADFSSPQLDVTGSYISDETTTALTRNIYVDVRPHILTAAFSPASIANNGTDTTTLTLTIKDLNGCANLDGATVTADLTSLGGSYTSTETLTHSSCDAGAKTATFQKTGIISLASTGAKSISFAVTDEDGNTNNPADVNFGSIDLNPSTVSLTLNDSSAPTVDTLTISDSIIGGTGQTSATLTMDGSSETEEYKMVIGNYAQCEGGAVITDWTSGGTSSVAGVVNASALSEGSNTLYACVRRTIGSCSNATYLNKTTCEGNTETWTASGSYATAGSSVLITKDTQAATLTFVSATSTVDAQGDTGTLTWSSNEVGTFDTKQNGSTKSSSNAYASASAQQVNNFIGGFTIVGDNTVEIIFTDEAGNASTLSRTIVRVPPPPSMAGVTSQVVTLVDNDNLFDSVDGRDLTVSWVTDSSISGYGDFYAYAIYILPTTTPFNASAQDARAFITEVNATSVTLSSSKKYDSALTLLAGGNYKAYVAVLSTAGKFGSNAISASSAITSDALPHPTLQSMNFVSDTEMQLLYDIDVSTTIADHDGSNILFHPSDSITVQTSCNGNTNGVKTISGKYISFCVSSLGNIAKTLTLLGQNERLYPQAVEVGDVFTVTIGSTSVSFTATVATSANVVSGLVSAMNTADFSGDVTGGLTASDQTDHVFLYPNTKANIWTSVLVTADGGTIDTQDFVKKINMEESIRAYSGGFNCHDSSISGCSATDWSMTVGDKQVPSPIALGDVTLGSATYSSDVINQFFTGNITLNWNNPELLSSNSKIVMTRTGGEVDVNSVHNIPMTGKLAAGAQSIILDPTDLLGDSTSTTTDVLVSSAYYTLSLAIEDIAGNTQSSNTKSGIKYDTTSPSDIIVIPYPNALDEADNATSDTTPTLSWFSSSDNANGSGLHPTNGYQVQLSIASDFSSIFETNFIAAGATEYTVTGPLTGSPATTYYWRVRSQDALGNYSAWSEVSSGVPFDFLLDSTVANISSLRIDVPSRGITGGAFVKQGETVNIVASIANSALACIELDISSLKSGSTAVAPNTYATGVATWTGIALDGSITEGLKSLTVQAKNANCSNPTFQTSVENVTVDNTAPAVTTGLTSLTGGDIIKGGDSYAITWDSGSITETNFKDITLSFSANSGGAWTEIANSLPNNGSYNWAVPSVDSSTYRVKMDIYDQVAQSATSQSSSDFIIDNTAPVVPSNTITSPNGGETFYGGQNVTISWNSVSATDASISGNAIDLEYSIDGGSSFIAINNPSSKLSKTDTSYSWTIPSNVNTAQAHFKIIVWDKAGNAAGDTSDGYFSIDSIVPTITSRHTQDLDSDGQIDAIKITFSENISDTTIQASDFSITGYAGLSFSSFTNGDAANNNIIYITFTESGSSDSGAIPSVTYTKGTLTDAAGNFLVTTSVISTDLSTPVLLSRVTQDTNADGVQDGVLLTFSETMDASQVTSASFEIQTQDLVALTETYSDGTDDATLLLTYTGGNAFDTDDLTRVKILNTNFKDMNGNALAVDNDFVSATDAVAPVFSVSTGIATGTPTMNITFSEKVDSSADDFTVWTLSDSLTANGISTLDGTAAVAVLNISTSFTNTALTPTLTYTAGDIVDTSGNTLPTSSKVATDTMSPYILSISIHDDTIDGNIDQARVTYSENIDTGTVQVSDYSLDSVAASTHSVSGAVLTLNFSGVSGTDVKDVLYSGSTTADSLGNTASVLLSGDITETDSAGPVIISATYIEGAGADSLRLAFSENIDDSTLAIADFVIAGGGNLTGGTITSGAANDHEIVLGNITTALTVGVSTINFSADSVVADVNGVNNAGTSVQSVSGAIIINEVSWAGSSASALDEYIELRNMGTSSVDISGWTIEQAANSGTITIPGSTTLSAGGLYLISHFAESSGSSKLNITPDFVTTDLSLADSSNGDLLLKNGSILVDQVEGDTWPAGDAGSFIAMERKESPGDGLVGTNWYNAITSVNFDAGSEKGTPKSANLYDITAPTIDSAARAPAVNTLYPNGQIDILLSYVDNVGGSGIDTSAVELFYDLDQNTSTDGAGFDGCEVAVTPTVTTTQLSYAFQGGEVLPVGRNKVCARVKDLAGNTSTLSWEFWIDNFTFSLSEITPQNFTVLPGVNTTITDGVLMTVQTYGAGVNIQAQSTVLDSGITTIPLSQFYFDARLRKKVDTGSVIDQHVYNGLLNFSGNSDVEIIAADAPSVGSALKTYYIYIKNELAVGSIQKSGKYNATIQYNVRPSY
ncbi:hypothetical protein COB57_04175 [Candidatus Peregrinibacteria bacterium]|nr:MAG: hypothetical protein COB57_04175 [Candidatus Peregrinibacteria bacterium]